MTVVNPAVDLIADTIMRNCDDVAACSHGPENVKRLWQDANARYLMAERIAEALGLPARHRVRVDSARLEDVARLYDEGKVQAVEDGLDLSRSQAYRLIRRAREQAYIEEQA